jgi:hypothetical protein
MSGLLIVLAAATFGFLAGWLLAVRMVGRAAAQVAADALMAWRTSDAEQRSAQLLDVIKRASETESAAARVRAAAARAARDN